MKGSSQRAAFTHVISFDSLWLPLGKVGVIIPTLQMRELRLRGVSKLPRSQAWPGLKVSESKSRALVRHQSLRSDSPPAWLHYQGAVCLQPRRRLLDVSSIGETELSPFLVIYELS